MQTTLPDEFIDPLSMGGMYIRQGNRRTTQSDAFFNDLPRLISHLEATLSFEVGFAVSVVPDSNLYLCCVRNVAEGTPENVFVEQLRLHRQAFTRHKLWKKWYVDRDRDLVEKRPMLSNGRHRRDPLSSNAYYSDGGGDMRVFQDQINNHPFVRAPR